MGVDNPLITVACLHLGIITQYVRKPIVSCELTIFFFPRLVGDSQFTKATLALRRCNTFLEVFVSQQQKLTLNNCYDCR